jgi:hypothetical protein
MGITDLSAVVKLSHSSGTGTVVRMFLGLKQELQREVHPARRLRLKDMVERGRTDVRVGQPEICAVQHVKQLRFYFIVVRCRRAPLPGDEVPGWRDAQGYTRRT